MRVLQTGDLHLTNRGTVAGRYVLKQGVNLRLWDKIEAIRFICDYAESNELDLIAICGDLFDHGNPENVAIKVAVEAIERLVEQAPVVICKGNHDGAKGSEFASALAPFGKGMRKFGVYVSERPEIIPILSKNRKIQVFTLPYPRRFTVNSDPQYKTLSPEEMDRFVGFKMEEILSGFKADIDKNALNLLVGHFSVAGGMYSAEQTVPPFDIAVRTEFLEPFDLAMLGHLHEAQPYYAGTITRGGFGEESMKVGFKVHQVHEKEDGVKTRVEEQFIEIPSRKYLTVQAVDLLHGNVQFSELDRETVIRIKGRVQKHEYDEIVRKIRFLQLPFVKNAVEVVSETVRLGENEDSSHEPNLEEAVRMWAAGKEGYGKVVERLVMVAKELEFKRSGEEKAA